jgi:hypothetical protein
MRDTAHRAREADLSRLSRNRHETDEDDAVMGNVMDGRSLSLLLDRGAFTTDYLTQKDSSPGPGQAVMDKYIPLNTHERRRASASATLRIVDVSRAMLAAALLALLVASLGHAGHARDRLSGDVQRVKMIGFTVADVDREADFFTKVLRFEKVADFRVVGNEYDKMEGVFNANMRIVHLRLGDQIIELTQYVSPPTGRQIPVPSYSNDEWFEHIAIVVSDMDAAYKLDFGPFTQRSKRYRSMC